MFINMSRDVCSSQSLVLIARSLHKFALKSGHFVLEVGPNELGAIYGRVLALHPIARLHVVTHLFAFFPVKPFIVLVMGNSARFGIL